MHVIKFQQMVGELGLIKFCLCIATISSSLSFFSFLNLIKGSRFTAGCPLGSIVSRSHPDPFTCKTYFHISKQI